MLKFLSKQHINKLKDTFLDHGSIDGKGGVKVQKCHLVAELKLKMSLCADFTFSISALPPGGIFPHWLYNFLSMDPCPKHPLILRLRLLYSLVLITGLVGYDVILIFSRESVEKQTYWQTDTHRHTNQTDFILITTEMGGNK